MNVKSVIAAVGAVISLAACSPEPPLYFGPQFGPQLASLHGEADPQAINSAAFDLRPPLPGRPGYLETIKYIDDGVKYIDGFAEFFISYDGQLCFRGLVNRDQAFFENYQNYWCMPPTAVNSVRHSRTASVMLIRFACGAPWKPRNVLAGTGTPTFWMRAVGGVIA